MNLVGHVMNPVKPEGRKMTGSGVWARDKL